MLFTLAAGMLAGCSPSEAELTATADQIATGFAASLTAAAPTKTPTPTPSPTPAQTPTPLPDARVAVPVLDGFAEPAYDSEFVHRFEEGEGLYVIGRLRDCHWLQVRAPFGEAAWVNAQLDRVSLEVSCDGLPHGFYRPKTGSIITDLRSATGYGNLHVDNGLKRDAYVLLASVDAESQYGFYIRAEDAADLAGVPDGDFYVYFSTGEGWDAVNLRFTTAATYARFEDTVHFQSSFVQRAGWKITLHPVEGGEATVQTIPPGQFPHPDG